jgi:hypothetical protein
MPRSKSDSRALRQLAENLLRQTFGEYGLSGEEIDELATSLVRQWVTYEGHATLFINGRQVVFVRGWTPLGKDHVYQELGPPEGLSRFLEDWKINPEDMPEVYEQLNRGQSAEVTNADGLPVRISVDPKTKINRCEPLASEPVTARPKRDYHKLAAYSVDSELGPGLDDGEKAALADSVARQWQKYQGHACLFTAGKKLVFTLVEQEDGGCLVGHQSRPNNLGPQLCSLGFAPQAIPGVIARINLDQEIEFEDHQGARWCIWHDPSIEQLRFRPLGQPQPAASDGLPPALCPRCNALLSMWQEGQSRQTCPQCGQDVARP